MKESKEIILGYETGYKDLNRNDILLNDLVLFNFKMKSETFCIMKVMFDVEDNEYYGLEVKRLGKDTIVTEEGKYTLDMPQLASMCIVITNILNKN